MKTSDLRRVTYCGLYCGLCAQCCRIPQRARSLQHAMRLEGYEYLCKATKHHSTQRPK